ncbi:MAG: phosphopantetheinyl transferase [Chthonomonadaceae bacterium]|nr:phosphopantetheinyl transferase [Chthonomonadaceae bacterium]
MPSPNTLSILFSDETLSLAVEEVHVWQVEMDVPEARMAALSALLSVEEHARAARFHQEIHRHRYIAGRGILRLLLGRYTDLPPEALRFLIGSHGKPELAAAADPEGLQFNRSDAGGLALYAFGRGQRIGIDLEKIPDTFDFEPVARDFFTAHETGALLGLPDAQRLSAFYACWTRKEAYLKGRGDGLTFGLDRFEVSLLPDAPPALLVTPFDPAETLRWSLYDLTVTPGYIAALAVETEDRDAIAITQYALGDPDTLIAPANRTEP